MSSIFDMKNPDPNVKPFFTCLYKTIRQGELRSRYEIMKDANASEELQREMQELVVSLVASGVIVGLTLGAATVAVVYELHLVGLI